MIGRRVRVTAGLVAAWLAWALTAGACSGSITTTPPPQVPDGRPDLGAQAIARYGCGTCHTIPGIDGASGTVGPPLLFWSRRGYIAGQLTNGGENLIRWLMDPQAVEPGTDMPNLGVTEEDARNIAAYLFTLR